MPPRPPTPAGHRAAQVHVGPTAVGPVPAGRAAVAAPRPRRAARAAAGAPAAEQVEVVRGQRQPRRRHSTGAVRARTGWPGPARSPRPGARTAPPDGAPGRCRAGRPGPPARAAPPPDRPARPACCHSDGPGARVAGRQHRVQPGHVDAELERVGRRQPEQLPSSSARSSARRSSRRYPARYAATRSPIAGADSSSARRAAAATTSAPRRDLMKASVCTPWPPRGPAGRPPRAAGSGGPGTRAHPCGGPVRRQQRRFPQPECDAPARRRVLRHRRRPAGRPAAGRGQPARRSWPTPARTPATAGVPGRDHRRSRRMTWATCEPNTPRYAWHSSTDDERQPAEERGPPVVPGQDRPWSMSGVVRRYRAVAPDPVPFGPGRSPSKQAWRTAGQCRVRPPSELVGGQRLGRRDVERGGPGSPAPW